jgi:hypothetical protein
MKLTFRPTLIVLMLPFMGNKHIPLCYLIFSTASQTHAFLPSSYVVVFCEHLTVKKYIVRVILLIYASLNASQKTDSAATLLVCTIFVSHVLYGIPK